MGRKQQVNDSVGVDFGTSTTLIATRTGAISTAVPLGAGADPWLPSVVGLDGGKLLVGEQAESLPREHVVRSVKALLTAGQEVATTDAGEDIKVEDAVRALLNEAVDRATSKGLDLRSIPRVQLGCPAMWEAPQRQLLLRVADQCGIALQLGDVIDEPIAAGVAWIKDQQRTKAIPTSKVLIFDPGGGTLDVALLQVQERDGTPEITVLATQGVDESGDALDRSIAADLHREFGLALTTAGVDAVVGSLVQDRARDLKEALSSVDEEAVALGGGHTTVLRYTRRRLERTFAAQCERAMRLVQSVVRSGKLREHQTLTVSAIRQMEWIEASRGIEHVLLVGGLSHVPMIGSELQRLLPNASVHHVSRPQEAIARGLVFAEEFERLNLHRPGFNFEVTYLDGRKNVVGGPHHAYDAFTPLYHWQDLFTTNFDIAYRAQLPRCPGGTKFVQLACRSVDGHAIGLDINGQRHESFGVPISGTDAAYFTLYTNGDIRFGGKGGVKKLRVDRWPSLRGPHHNWTLGVTVEETYEPSGDGAAVYARPTRGR